MKERFADEYQWNATTPSNGILSSWALNLEATALGIRRVTFRSDGFKNAETELEMVMNTNESMGHEKECAGESVRNIDLSGFGDNGLGKVNALGNNRSSMKIDPKRERKLRRLLGHERQQPKAKMRQRRLPQQDHRNSTAQLEHS